jgi:hypothetical protein
VAPRAPTETDTARDPPVAVQPVRVTVTVTPASAAVPAHPGRPWTVTGADPPREVPVGTVAVIVAGVPDVVVMKFHV